MISIQTNVNSLVAQENLSVTSKFQSKTIQQLTSGYRINSSGDDAAGLAVANKYRSSIAELTQGVANGNDGVAQLQIMDGGMSNISSILDRLKTLATQSASGTFTGNRATLNGEFQTDLAEIDRQAQSIGLNTGGTFASNLQVYLGAGSGSGGVADSGAAATANSLVGIDLSKSTVDSQSLGLKGFQVRAGSVDIGDGAGDTTVAKIKAQSANGTSGATTFNFAGPGFSDNSKVQVSVNLASVTNLDTLVTAINAGIQGAGNGTSQAATAFKDAGISASVFTNTDGTRQLAFTSSTSAFQVEAGDQMANAFMGSFSSLSSATGNSISTTLNASHAYDATGGDAITATTVRITGSGLDVPVDLVLTSTTAGTAKTELINALNTDGRLQRAGISVADNGTRLVFTNTSGESFGVEATGDTNNRLGLGSFNAGLSGAVDYTTIDGTGYLNNTAATQGTASLEISLNGGVSETPISINLAQGNATQAAVSGVTVGDTGFIINNSNHTVNVSVNGTPTVVTLTNSTLGNEAIKSGTVLTGDAGIAIAAATAGALQTSAVDYSIAANCDFSGGGLDSKTFSVSVDGDTAQAVVLNADYTDVTGVAGAIAGQLSGVNVTHDATSITITSKTTGVAGTVQFSGADRASLGFASAALQSGLAGNNTLSFQADGGTARTVTLDANTYTGATLLTNINSKLGGLGMSAGFAGATTGFTGTQYAGLGGVLTFKSTTGVGTDKSLVFNAPANSANTILGLVAPTTTAHGTNTQTFTLADIAGELTSQLGAATATAATGVLTLTTAAFGTASKVQVTGGNGAAELGLTDATAHIGLNRTIDDIKDYLNQAFTTNTNMQNAGLEASVSGTILTVASNNGTNFRVNAAGSGGLADIGFGVLGNSFAAGQTGAASSSATVLDAQGTSYIKDDGGVVGFSFAALKYGNDDQAITISANDPTGAMKSKTITVSNDAAARNGRDIDEAITYINSQLQQTNDPTLQKIVAVKDSSSGTEKINFLSSLISFTAALGSSANTDGLASGAASTYASKTNGTAGTVSISSQLGAQAAITAIGNAVSALGSAQAAVGKGQNQLSYAVSLAQSQITNLSAAQAQIRDADVAQQAANLTKAQVLSQASIAAMAQANSAPQAVLSLLRG